MPTVVLLPAAQGVDPVVRTVYRVRTVVLTFSGSMTTRSPIFPLGCTRSTSSSSLQSRPPEGRVDRVLTAEVMGGSGVCCRFFGKVVPTSAGSFEHITCASALPIRVVEVWWCVVCFIGGLDITVVTLATNPIDFRASAGYCAVAPSSRASSRICTCGWRSECQFHRVASRRDGVEMDSMRIGETGVVSRTSCCNGRRTIGR